MSVSRCPICSALLAIFFIAPALQAQQPKSRQFALVVGVRQYPRGVLGDLNFTDNDAEDLGAWLRDKGGFDVVTIMTQARGANDTDLLPTKRNIERNLDEILKLVRPRRGDRIVVALSGHGVEYPDEQAANKTEAFFCPADVEKPNKRLENLVSLKTIYKKLDDSDADIKILVVDACREIKGDKGGAEDFDPPHPPKGIAAFFSCDTGQKSFEYDRDKPDQPRHGLFLHRFLEGLNGAGAKDGKVTLESLAAYVKETVPIDAKSVISVKANQDPRIVTDTSGKQVVLALVSAAAGKPRPLKSPFSKEAAKEGQEAWAKYLGKKVEEEIDLGGGLKMVFELIPPGTFKMGSPDEELKLEGNDMAHYNEVPRHEVTITKPFYLGKYVVTQGEYVQLTAKRNPSFFKTGGSGRDRVAGLDTSRFPVEQVDWNDAMSCASAMEGRAGAGWVKARLPSEAMWEYACRAGTATRWHVGNRLTNDDAHFDQQGDGKLNRTRAVGGGVPNAFGLYDMHGNVFQWCSDYYSEYSAAGQTDPEGPTTGSDRVRRSGGWSGHAGDARSANRTRDTPSNQIINLGFRLALVPSDQDK